MSRFDGGNLSQIVLGFLAAFTSIAVVFGSLFLAFAEGGVGQAFIRTPPITPTSTEIPRMTPLVTLKPGQATSTPAPTETFPPTATETAACPFPSDWTTMTVQSGDTLESLAQANGVSVQQLKEANCLLTDRLQPGLFLYVPGTSTSTLPPEQTDTLVPSRTPVPCGPLPGWVRYRVQRGDTLYSLATSTGTTVREVQFANCLGYSTHIQAGQILYLPKNPPTQTPEPADTKTPTPTTPVAPNIPPVGNPDSYSVNEDTALNISAPGVLGNDTDSNGDPLNSVLVNPPASGTLVLSPNGSFVYTPPANFNGTVTFTYRANDGFANSNPVTVTLTVNPVNDAPVAGNDSYTMDEDTILAIASPGVLGNDSDPDGNALTAVLVTGPGSGLVLNPDGSFTFTPTLNFIGIITFTYRANDGSTDSNVATVTITVNSVNDLPSAVGDSYSMTQDTSLNVSAPGVLGNDTDVDGNPLTAVLESPPASGIFSLNTDGSFDFTPPAATTGPFSFTYHANDGTANSTSVTVTITVNPP